MNIESKELLSYNYYTYGQPFTGSCRGMRYRLSRVRAAAETSGAEFEFEAAVWPEPYAEAFTDPAQIRCERFPFTPDGKEEAVSWLNMQYEQSYL